MEFFEVIHVRRSVRAFQARAVEEEKIKRILEAANRAPSAGNLQAYEIFLVTSQQRRDELARAALGQDFLSQAPVCLVFCAHPARLTERYGERGRRLYAIQDATIACTFAMLAATALGLASVWVGAFEDEAVRRAIRAPKELQPVAILAIGYGAETPTPTSRRRLAELVHREKD